MANNPVVNQWLKNRQHAMKEGRMREVKRINKILTFYGHKIEKDYAV